MSMISSEMQEQTGQQNKRTDSTSLFKESVFIFLRLSQGRGEVTFFPLLAK